MRHNFKIDQIIYWIRSSSSVGDELVPMYYKGLCRDASEGTPRFDIQARPRNLGPGEYTAVYGGTDFKPAPAPNDTVIED